ncbi:hypothetical protein AAFF_G00293820 [Aldrovandia affinis]|uniref:Uncharacterized protein n=1 Tax=Aldrovandia affinis TaxID=143900 RepID=A0AAD7R9T8_9TELE|nr:hypothetical protein AAFF_G00293820 [Aldrovandia affinis]
MAVHGEWGIWRYGGLFLRLNGSQWNIGIGRNILGGLLRTSGNTGEEGTFSYMNTHRCEPLAAPFYISYRGESAGAALV